uniref:WIBG Mago-binding domain-containing protein n=1 Tax=Panagrolaimus sp. JU765 TaxID=591449 RepID=A0AC34RLW6_9BILA
MSVSLPLPNYIVRNEKGELIEKASVRPDGSVRKQRKVRFVPFVPKRHDTDYHVESTIKVDEGYGTDSDSCRGSPTKDGDEIEIEAEAEAETLKKEKQVKEETIVDVNENDSKKLEVPIEEKTPTMKMFRGKRRQFKGLKIVHIPRNRDVGPKPRLSLIREKRIDEEDDLTGFGSYWKEIHFDYIHDDEMVHFQFLLEEALETFDVNDWNDQMRLACLLVLAEEHGYQINIQI